MPTHIAIGPYSALLPDAWNDMNRPQLLHVMAALLATGYQNIRSEALLSYQRLEILRALTAMPATALLMWQQSCVAACDGDAQEGQLLYLSELDAVCQQVRFAFEPLDQYGDPIPDPDGVDTDTPDGPDADYDTTEQPAAYRLRLGLTRCPYPVVSLHRNAKRAASAKATPTLYYAPSDGLDNVSIHELAHIFARYEAYARSQAPDDLHLLLATVYREARTFTREEERSGWRGDKRRPLRDEEGRVAVRARAMATMPPVVAQLCYFWLASCLSAIVRDYPDIFEQPGSEPSDDPNFGWAGLMLELAGGVVHLDTVADTSWHTVFLHLRMRIAQAEAQKKKNRLLHSVE